MTRDQTPGQKGEQLERIQDQFTRTADIYARMRQATDERSLDALVALCDPPQGTRALDVACGPGFLTLALARRCAQATGFDATDAFIELARAEAMERGQSNLRYRQGDALALPFDDGAFGLVTCRAAFHHFPSPEKILAEMCRVSAVGGRILVADLLGNENGEQAALHDRIERLCDPTHERALPATRFHTLFEESGLAIVHDIRSTIGYELTEWIDHGAPPEGDRREIVALMEASIQGDRAGLDVRREDGRLHFRHCTAAFVLEHAISPE
jgi:ubiquinone/menaquinone biosynthesis C-methylase UbiE